MFSTLTQKPGKLIDKLIDLDVTLIILGSAAILMVAIVSFAACINFAPTWQPISVQQLSADIATMKTPEQQALFKQCMRGTEPFGTPYRVRDAELCYSKIKAPTASAKLFLQQNALL